ncbi:hypothetical protein [Fibrella aestuarina]|nr:hypothetical protein [Fibrella aestuarina]
MSRLPILLLSVGVTALGGCATLTKSQVEAVNQFATLASTGGNHAEKVLNEVIDNRYQSIILEQSAGVNPGTATSLNGDTYKQLAKFYADKQAELKPVRQIKASMNVLNEYALALQRLSSPDFATNAAQSANSLGESISDLSTAIPVIPNVGSLLGKTLTELGGRYIGQKQTKALQQFVNEGDTLVAALCRSNESLLREKASVLIEQSEKTDSLSVNALFDAIKTDRLGRYQAAGMGADLVSKYQHLNQLNKQSITALQQIRTTHSALKKALATKQTLSGISQQLLALHKAIRDLQATYKEIKL